MNSHAHNLLVKILGSHISTSGADVGLLMLLFVSWRRRRLQLANVTAHVLARGANERMSKTWVGNVYSELGLTHVCVEK